MPSVLIIVNNGNSDASNGRWRAGEAILADTDRDWGWKEVPKYDGGQRTVAQVNAMDLSATDPYMVVEMLDAGMVSAGREGEFYVEAGDAICMLFTETFKFWRNFGPRPSAEYDEKLNYHWRVSDKTNEEMEAYLERHNKAIEMTTVNGPDPSGFRRIEVVNLYVTASGDNSWTREGVDAVLEGWNLRYPDSDLAEYQPYTASTVFFEGTFTTGQAQEFEEVIVNLGLSQIYAQRRWYITSQGMTALANNDGFMNTTAQELGTVFRDGLLD